MYRIKTVSEIVGVNPKTIRRWEKSGKIRPKRSRGNQRCFSVRDINQLKLLKAGKPQVVQAHEQLLLPPPKRPLLWQKFLAYSTLLLLIFGLIRSYLLDSQFLAQPTAIQEFNPASEVNVALPQVANFLNGRITLGSDSGDLAFLDQQGNFYLKNTALIEGELLTTSLRLLPSAPPQAQIGRQYVDQETGDLMYYDGVDWVSLNPGGSASSSSGLNQSSYLVTNQDLDLTLGDLTASTSAESLRITLAGPQSQFKLLGGANQELLTINDDLIYPILLNQPTKIMANLYLPKLVDSDSEAYFLDPSAPGVGLSLAGEATIASTLKFSKYGEYISNSEADYLVFSGGIGINNSTSYGFTPDYQVKAKTGRFENSVYVDGQALLVPDFVFEPDYPLLSPLALSEYIHTHKHLPNLESAEEIKNQGLNLSQFLLNLLAKTEENVLYLLELYQRVSRLEEKILSPLASDNLTAKIIESEVIKPLDNQTLIIQANQVITDELVATKIKADTIEGLKEKLAGFVDELQPATIAAEPLPASAAAVLGQLDEPLNSAYPDQLELESVSANAGFFSEYLAVIGQASFTSLKINDSLFLNSITSLDNQLALQPSGLGRISLLAGLMILDENGNVTINGRLTVNGPIIASQIETPLNEPLAITIASQSALILYNDIHQPLASFSGQTAQFSQINLAASGIATISAGTNHVVVNADKLTPQSQILVTFTSDYKPASKYWVNKFPEQNQFIIFINYPANNDTALDWMIIN